MHVLRAFALAAVLVAPSACSRADTTADGHPIVASGLGTVQQLAASDGYLYFAQLDSAATQTWTLERVPDGGGTPQAIVRGIAQPTSLAVDHATVYWTDISSFALYAAPASGLAPGATPTVVAATTDPAVGVVVAGGRPFVVEASGFLAFSIVDVLGDGGAPLTVASAAAPSAVSPTVVSDGSAVYFMVSDLSCSSPSCILSTVYRYAPGDAAPTALLGSPLAIDQLATDGTSVYFSELRASGDLWNIASVPARGGAAVNLASGLRRVSWLAASSGAVYWASSGGIWMVPQAGGAPTQVSTSAFAGEMAVDDDGVFAFDSDPAAGQILVAESR